MSEAKIGPAEARAFTINLPSVGAPVTVRTESDEVLVSVILRIRPRENVMNVDLKISTGGDGASASCLDQNAAETS